MLSITFKKHLKEWLFTGMYIVILGFSMQVPEYNYPNFREQYRHPHQKRLLEELPMMKTLEEEERPTYFQRMSRDSGLLRLSVLHRLYPLNGFDVLRDTVFDAMHLLPLNVVKNHIERWITQGYLEKKDLNTNLSKMLWTVCN